VITASAIDSNGATAGAKITVRTAPNANAVKITANIESGIAPFETTLRIDGYASNTIPNITYTGPGTVDFSGCTSYDACRVKIATEGIYYFTVTATGTDGNTYKDTVAVTVLSRSDLDVLLKAKWEGMKGALASGNVEGAVVYFVEGSKDSFRKQFNALAPHLTQIVADMGEFNLVKVIEHVAECDLKTVRNGVTYSFQVLFIKNTDGMWGIRSF